MERRNFLRNGGLLGAILGATGSAVSLAQPAAAAALPTVVPTKEDISHLAPPENAYTLQIAGSYQEKKPEPQLMNNGMMFMPINQATTHSVSMTVGKDNRLWIKVGDKWQRVALES